MALFLVDPGVRIISTAHVPPQRQDWWLESIWQNRALPRLSLEIQKKIVDEVTDFPFSLEEAKEFRRALMDQRGAFVRKQDKKFAENTFSLCEH